MSTSIKRAVYLAVCSIFIFAGISQADRMGFLLEEVDGSPAGYVLKLKMPNGTISSLTNSVGTIDLSGLGGGTVNGVGDCTTSADCLDGTSDGGTYIRLYDGTSSYTSITGGVRSFTVASGLANAEAFTVTLGDNNNTITVTSGTGANSLVLSSIGLTVGGTLALGANNLTMTGSLGATGAGKLTKVWAVDGEFTNTPTVNGVAANASSGLVLNPLTTQYDILVGGASGAATRLASSANVHSFLGSANTAAMKGFLSIDDLVTLSGVADGAVNLGAFSGSTIADNQTIKAALQALETAVEGVTGLSDNSIDQTQLKPIIAFADGDFVDFGAITMSAGVDEGLTLPAWANVTPATTTKYFATWDTSAKSFKVQDGGSWYSFAAVAAPLDSPYLLIGANDATLTGDRRMVIGNGLTGTDAGANSTYTLAMTPATLTGNQSWSNGSSDATITVTYNLSSGTDPVWTYTNGVANLSTGALQVGGTAVSTYANPLTTRGDLVYQGASAASRLAIGASGKILTTNGTDPAWSAYTVDAPGLTGAVLASDGTNWARSTAPAISAANMTNFPTLNQNTTGTASNLSGTPALPNGTTATTQSAGDNSTKLATTAYANALVSDTAYDATSWNGVTAIAPSKNAVRDQIELLATIASPTLTGTPAAPTASANTNTTQIATTAFVLGQISDTAYDATSWNAVTTIAPSKNAVRDQIELMPTLAGANTFTANNVFGDGDTDTLTVRSLLVGGNSRAVQIAGTLASPTYATANNELYVAGDIESGGSIYATSFSAGTGTDGQRRIDFNSNTTFTCAGNQLYVLNNAFYVCENGTAKDIPMASDSITWNGATFSLAGVTNLLLPTATPDATGEVGGWSATGWGTGHGSYQIYDGTNLVRIVATTSSDTPSNGQVPKWNTGGTITWEDDLSAGAPALNTVTDPSGDTTFAFDAGEEINFNFTGNFTTGSQFLIEQKTGDPSGGVLFEVKQADGQPTIMKVGDGTNGIQVAAGGALSAIGNGSITATALTGNVSGGTSESVTTYVAIGADPADAGAIRLSNAGYIMSEASPAGTDISVIGVDSSEVIQIGTSGASGVTVTPAVTLSGGATLGGTLALAANNLTMTGSLAATGARVTKGWFTEVESTNPPTINGGTLAAGALLTGYTSGSGTVAGTDSILAGIQKLNGNIEARLVTPANDPDLTASGSLGVDLNGQTIRSTFDAGTTQKAIARAQEEIHVTVYKPQDLDDAQRDHFWIWSNESGMTFVVTGWKAWSTSDDTSLTIYEEDSDGQNDATVDAVEIATNGTGLYYGSDTTITGPNIENGHLMYLDFDDTDAPAMVKITIYGYYNSNVN